MTRDKIISIIDIGSSKITTLIASVSDEEKINIIGVSSSEAKGIRKGQVIDIEDASFAITKSLEAAERMAGFTVGTAFVSVGGIHISSINSHGVVAVSRPEEEIVQSDIDRVMEASRAISLPSAREIIHAIPRGFIVDSQEGIKDASGMTGVRLEVDTHIITGSTTSIKNLNKCLNDIGIETERLIFGGLASSYSVLTETEKELGVILVDIGGGTIDVCIFIEGALSYSAVLPVGAKNITNDLAIGLRVSLESAEKIKIALSKKEKKIIYPEDKTQNYDNPPTSRHTKDKLEDIDLSDLNLPEGLKAVSKKTIIDGIIKPRLQEIFTLIGIEIQKSGLGGFTPSGIVITGGGALTVGIIDTCKTRLALPTRIGIPEGVTGLIDEIESPLFSASVGLILYGVKFDFGKDRKKDSIGKFFNFPFKNSSGKFINLLKSFLP